MAANTLGSPMNNDPDFDPGSFWYQQLPSDAPLHPDSAALVDEFLAQMAGGKDNLVGINSALWSSPVYIAADDCPRITVGVNRCLKGVSDAHYASLEEQFRDVPMPDFAQAPADSDAQMAIYHPSTDTMWEFWQVQKTNGAWQACWGGRMSEVSRGDGIWPSPFGATATGLSLVGGQITAEELQAGSINHVMGIALVQAALDVNGENCSWPAQRSDGEGCASSVCIPEGLRFRLDPTVDIEALALTPVGKIIAKAAQDFGFVVWDKAGTTSLRCKNALSYTVLGKPDPYPELFGGIDPANVLDGLPWNRLQFLPPDYGRPPKLLYVHREFARKSKQVDDLLERYISPFGPGAAVMVIQDHDVLHKKGYGLASLDGAGSVPITPWSVFRLASLTKSFTAMGIAIVMDRNLLRPDDRLRDFFDRQPANEIQIRHLLHHTAGLQEFDQLFFQFGMIDTLGFRSERSPHRHFEPTIGDVLTLLETQPLLSAPPGEAFHYSNSAYVCLAAIIEAVSGTTFGKFLNENIFVPLGMDHTFVNDDAHPLTENVAHSYDFAGVATGQDIDYSPLNRVLGEDGVFSNLEDLYKWDQALCHAADQSAPPHILVSDRMLDRIFTRGRLNDRTTIDAGYGWFITPDGSMADHSGQWAGYRTYIRRYLQDRFTIVVLSNYAIVDPVAIGEAIDRIYFPPSTGA